MYAFGNGLNAHALNDCTVSHTDVWCCQLLRCLTVVVEELVFLLEDTDHNASVW